MGREGRRRRVRPLAIRWMISGVRGRSQALWLGGGEGLRELGGRMVFLRRLVETME